METMEDRPVRRLLINAVIDLQIPIRNKKKKVKHRVFSQPKSGVFCINEPSRPVAIRSMQYAVRGHVYYLV